MNTENNTQQPPSPEVTAVKQRLGIIGNAPALNSAVERAIRVAPIDLSVLIIGQSGTGKEFFPKIIHQNSPRRHNKYIAVNCGAIPEGTIDSELFGHEKGAFTGAVSSRKGYFEEANGGTIFLDEVAELPLTTQARLLRVLETGEFIKVGSSTVQRTNIRIVAATNVDMSRAIAEGRFREDLYYRLSTILINVPPLNQRGHDIILLTRKFLSDFSERYRTPLVTLTEDARTRLLTYNWPGNVRQLKNVVEQIALFEGGKTIDATVVDNYLPQYLGGNIPAPIASVNTYEREREAIFNLIFRLQREIDELKSMLRKNDDLPEVCYSMAPVRDDELTDDNIRSYNASRMPESFKKEKEMREKELMARLNREFHNLSGSSFATGSAPDDIVFAKEEPRIIVPAESYKKRFFTPPGYEEEVEVVDIDEPELMTLEETEREMIRRALERNNGRRKAAAADLKISERTLYRKIKEYGLD